MSLTRIQKLFLIIGFSLESFSQLISTNRRLSEDQHLQHLYADSIASIDFWSCCTLFYPSKSSAKIKRQNQVSKLSVKIKRQNQASPRVLNTALRLY